MKPIRLAPAVIAALTLTTALTAFADSAQSTFSNLEQPVTSLTIDVPLQLRGLHADVRLIKVECKLYNLQSMVVYASGVSRPAFVNPTTGDYIGVRSVTLTFREARPLQYHARNSAILRYGCLVKVMTNLDEERFLHKKETWPLASTALPPFDWHHIPQSDNNVAEFPSGRPGIFTVGIGAQGFLPYESLLQQAQ